MEQEYTSSVTQYSMKNFQVTVAMIMVVTLTVIFNAIIHANWTNLAISGTMFAVLVAMFAFRKVFAKYIDYLTLFAIFSYNLYRLIYLNSIYNEVFRADLFYSGYTYAILEMILISRCHKIQQKVVAIVFGFFLRFGIVIFVIDSKAFDALNIFRHVLVDLFVIYYFYMNEKTGRQVFQSYYENREEIMKFKELLDDSLPQSVTVIDCNTIKPLFSNKACLNAFESNEMMVKSQQEIPNISNPTAMQRKPNLNFLVVDQSTTREIKEQNVEAPSFTFAESATYLKEFIENMIHSNLINDRVVSVTASYRTRTQKRRFDITLKKVRWDRVDAITLMINDITYQENLLTLKAANANKDKIIATVSHELRTPLNGIIGLLEITQQKSKQTEVLEYLSMIKDNAKLLLSLVNSHLDLQQLSAGKLKLSPIKASLYKILNDIVQLFQFQALNKNIFLNFSIEEGLNDSVITDENRLKQILINLIGNAMKFTSKGGIHIEISDDPDELDCLLFSVKDTGIGIKEEDRGKLFQNYGKLEDKEGLNRGGVGLGLTISNVLAAMLAGRPSDARGIEVESQYGVGSRFYFRVLKDLKKEIDLKTRNKNTLKELEEEDHNDDMNELVLHTESVPLVKANDEKTEFDINNIPQEGLDESPLPLNISSKMASYFSLPKTNLNKLPTLQQCQDCLIQEGSDDHLGNIFCHQHQVLYHRINTLKSNLSGSDKEEPNKDQSEGKEGYILVVDDNPFNILVTKNCIEGVKCSVKTAMNGQEAIETVKSCAIEGQAIKVILMDCHMPIMDGYEATRILKEMMKQDEIPKVPIIAFTAGNSEAEVKRCYEAGMEGELMKPLSQESFIKALEKLNK